LKYGSSQAMDDELLSITEVGQATGLPSSALRYYERAGLLAPAARVGGRRHYSPDVLHRLAIIGLFQEAGFTISEIGDLLNSRPRGSRWRSLATDKLKEIDAHIERITETRRLLTAALACECSSLESCELVGRRRGPHKRAIQTLSLKMIDDASR
jgi:MerR family redox-sensitive transcriptional activator SoxR